jgi:hypothetical protein
MGCFIVGLFPRGAAGIKLLVSKNCLLVICFYMPEQGCHYIRRNSAKISANT